MQTTATKRKMSTFVCSFCVELGGVWARGGRGWKQGCNSWRMLICAFRNWFLFAAVLRGSWTRALFGLSQLGDLRSCISGGSCKCWGPVYVVQTFCSSGKSWELELSSDSTMLAKPCHKQDGLSGNHGSHHFDVGAFSYVLCRSHSGTL